MRRCCPQDSRTFRSIWHRATFPNLRRSPGADRPLYNASTAGELVRFVFASTDTTNPNSVGRTTEFGVPVSLINLNSFTSATPVEVALAALNDLRPDPTHAEVEQLIASGNSFYQGLTLELRKGFRQSSNNLGFSFRAAYTISSLTDDGGVNTSDALIPGDFRRERARSLWIADTDLFFRGRSICRLIWVGYDCHQSCELHMTRLIPPFSITLRCQRLANRGIFRAMPEAVLDSLSSTSVSRASFASTKDSDSAL